MQATTHILGNRYFVCVGDIHLTPGENFVEKFPFSSKEEQPKNPFSVLLRYIPEHVEYVYFVVAGDLTAHGTCDELKYVLGSLLETLSRNKKIHLIVVAGNHDECLQPETTRTFPSHSDTSYQTAMSLIEEARKKAVINDVNHFHYLTGDRIVNVCGVDFYGSPFSSVWTQDNRTAFQKWDSDVEYLADHFKPLLFRKDRSAPLILIVHGPPFGINDPGVGSAHAGSVAVRNLIELFKEDINAVIFGHLHGGYGFTWQDGVLFLNCAVKTEDYQLRNLPLSFSLSLPETPVVQKGICAAERRKQEKEILEAVAKLLGRPKSVASVDEEKAILGLFAKILNRPVKVPQQSPPFHTKFSVLAGTPPSAQTFQLAVVQDRTSPFTVSEKLFYNALKKQNVTVKVVGNFEDGEIKNPFPYSFVTTGSTCPLLANLDTRNLTWHIEPEQVEDTSLNLSI